VLWTARQIRLTSRTTIVIADEVELTPSSRSADARPSRIVGGTLTPLAYPDVRERLDDDARFHAQGPDLDLTPAAQVLDEATIVPLARPSACLGDQCPAERLVVDESPHRVRPASDLPDASSQVDGLLRQEAEKDL
jgi:hypothetical protein